MNGRFGEWGDKGEIKTEVVDKSKVIEPPVEELDGKKPKDDVAIEGKEEPKKLDDAEESEEVKGLKKELFKKREKIRAERAEKLALAEENRKLKSEKALNVEDFESFEDYEKAKVEASKTADAGPDPVVTGAIADLSKEIEKAGLDVKEVTEALAEMAYLPGQVVISLVDHEDAAKIAKWLSENEDDEAAQRALRARTDIGRMRAFDKIAELVAEKPKKAVKPKDEESDIGTITRLSGNAVKKTPDKMSTEEFVASHGNQTRNRFNW